MAIKTRIIKDSLTEIYINGGGNFITEAFPTNFHTFTPKKVLAPGETVDQFREVTPAERATIEAADATWVRPEQAVIDMWNRACIGRSSVLNKHPKGNYVYGQWNENTGFGELYDLKDITTSQMLLIMKAGYKGEPALLVNGGYKGLTTRANLPSMTAQTSYIDLPSTFQYASALEVVSLPYYYTSGEFRTNKLSQTFYGCQSLRKIVTPIKMQAANAITDAFTQCGKLQIVYLQNVMASVSLKDSSGLQHESLRYLVDNAANTADIYITVHADVYASLQGTAPAYPFNGGSREEWVQLLADAAERRISFSSV